MLVTCDLDGDSAQIETHSKLKHRVKFATASSLALVSRPSREAGRPENLMEGSRYALGMGRWTPAILLSLCLLER